MWIVFFLPLQSRQDCPHTPASSPSSSSLSSPPQPLPPASKAPYTQQVRRSSVWRRSVLKAIGAASRDYSLSLSFFFTSLRPHHRSPCMRTRAKTSRQTNNKKKALLRFFSVFLSSPRPDSPRSRPLSVVRRGSRGWRSVKSAISTRSGALFVALFFFCSLVHRNGLSGVSLGRAKVWNMISITALGLLEHN